MVIWDNLGAVLANFLWRDRKIFNDVPNLTSIGPLEPTYMAHWASKFISLRIRFENYAFVKRRAQFFFQSQKAQKNILLNIFLVPIGLHKHYTCTCMTKKLTSRLCLFLIALIFLKKSCVAKCSGCKKRGRKIFSRVVAGGELYRSRKFTKMKFWNSYGSWLVGAWRLNMVSQPSGARFTCKWHVKGRFWLIIN